jgi:hypothetical protein
MRREEFDKEIASGKYSNILTAYIDDDTNVLCNVNGDSELNLVYSLVMLTECVADVINTDYVTLVNNMLIAHEADEEENEKEEDKVEENKEETEDADKDN